MQRAEQSACAQWALDERRLLLENDKHWWESRWRLITGACSTLRIKDVNFLLRSTENCWTAPRRGWWRPLSCTLRHTAPSQKGKSGRVQGAHIFSCCISFMKGKNSDTTLLSLWVFLKRHENIPSAPNNFLWGSWNRVTQSVYLCLISKFLLIASPLQTCSPLNQLLAWGCLKC